MAYINFNSGFDVRSRSAIDKRVYLTKAQMLTAEDDLALPDTYFAVCVDDGAFYLYNKDNTIDTETGKFRVIDDTIKFATAAAKATLASAIASSTPVTELNARVDDAEEAIDKKQDALDTTNGLEITKVGEISTIGIDQDEIFAVFGGSATEVM